MAQNLFTPHTGKINSYQRATRPRSSSPGKAERKHSARRVERRLSGALSRAGAGGAWGQSRAAAASFRSAAPLHPPALSRSLSKQRERLTCPRCRPLPLRQRVLEGNGSLLADTAQPDPAPWLRQGEGEGDSSAPFNALQHLPAIFAPSYLPPQHFQ